METNHTSVPILQYDKWGNLIREWPSASAAALKLGLNYSKILLCTNGHKAMYQNYIWRKKDNPLQQKTIVELF